MNHDKKLPTIGFVGTGAITTALVKGLCLRAADFPCPIVVSPRGKENAAQLKRRFPERVTVAESNQEVLDRADWVVLAVVPAQGEEICRALRFRPEHKVISLLSDKPLDTIRAWIGSTQVLTHMIPLTFNAVCDGPITLCPPNEEAAAIFGRIGHIVPLDDVRTEAVFSTVTGYITAPFTVLDRMIQWAADKGVPRQTAADYISRFFCAVFEQSVCLNADEIHTMAEVTTPGGLNYMVRDFIQSQDGFSLWTQAAEPVFERVLPAEQKR